MMKLINYIILLSILVLPIFTSAQSIKSQMEQIRAGDQISFAMPVNISDFAVYVDSAEYYQNDTVNDIRFSAQQLLAYLYRKSTSVEYKSLVTEALVKGCGDKDTRISGYTLSKLETYPAQHFSYSAKNTLINIYYNEPTHYSRFIRLVGFLEITDLVNPIKQSANSGQLNNKNKWAAYLALARMGDEQSINKVIKMAEQVPVNNMSIYTIVPDVLYVKQPDILPFIKKILNSDERLCSSPNPEYTKPMICGYRIMEFLAQAVNNFPYPITASGDIDADDYKTALKVTREWLEQNIGQIDFNRDIY